MNNHSVRVCVFSLPLPDGVGEHRGDAGHVLRDGGHLPVPPHGHGGCPGVRQLAQLQRDRGGEEHVVRRSDEAVPPPGCVRLFTTVPESQNSLCLINEFINLQINALTIWTWPFC